MLRFSEGLRNALVGTGSLRSLLTGTQLRIYSGAQPASADAGIGSATLLCTVTVNSGSEGLNFESAITNGTLIKSASEVWSGLVVASGTATFFRLTQPADTGAPSTTLYRVQGTAGVAGSDLYLSNPALTSGGTQMIDSCHFVMPEM